MPSKILCAVVLLVCAVKLSVAQSEYHLWKKVVLHKEIIH